MWIFFSDLFGMRPKLSSRLSIDSTSSVVSSNSMYSSATDFSSQASLIKAQSISSIERSRK